MFVVSLVLFTDWLTSNWKYIFILVSIHKFCIVYFEKYAVPISRGNSFFLVMENHFEKEWSPWIPNELQVSRPCPWTPDQWPRALCWVELGFLSAELHSSDVCYTFSQCRCNDTDRSTSSASVATRPHYIALHPQYVATDWLHSFTHPGYRSSRPRCTPVVFSA